MSKINSTLENLRISYQLSELNEDQINRNPIEFFKQWFDEALKAECDEPNAFVLSTVNNENRPRSRVVLLKGIEEEKFVFYTNYLSSKGEEVQHNKYVSMNFLWLPLQRQIRIEGKVEKVGESISDDYFKKRPRGSQLGAIASPQSKKLNSRYELEKLFGEVEFQTKDQENLMRPPHWGGYAIRPSYFEFWQGRPNRLHDRICYQEHDKSWQIFRLAP